MTLLPYETFAGESVACDLGRLAQLRAYVAEEINLIRDEPGRTDSYCAHYNAAMFALDYLEGDGTDAIWELILPLIGAPANPWPGLTGEKLAAIRKSENIAKARLLGLGRFPKSGPLSVFDKLRALRHRDWLEEIDPKLGADFIDGGSAPTADAAFISEEEDKGC